MTTLQAAGAIATARNFWLGVAAYLVPTFPIAYTWHLVVFAPTYDALGIYRPDPIIPFGFASMLIQGIVFSWAYPRLFPERGGGILKPGLVYGLALAILSWSFTTLPAAATNILAFVTPLFPFEAGLSLLSILNRRAMIRVALPNCHAEVALIGKTTEEFPIPNSAMPNIGARKSRVRRKARHIWRN